MHNIRKDFPFFDQKNQVAFFDSAASAQKPRVVIDKLADIYSYHYANIHRGIYDLSAKLTDDFEKVRGKVAKFIKAKSAKEIVFTKNATEAINLVAYSYGKIFINEGDEVLISAMEHHSNIVPWQQICKEKKAVLKIIPITDDGEIRLDELEKLISNRTKLIAITHMSNVFGSMVDIKAVAKLAKQSGAKLLVDSCQAIVHMKLDVQELDCDFLVFSSHKLYGPTGVGVLYGKKELLNQMIPYQTGGSMVNEVKFEETSFLDPPYRFEAGTPAIAEVIAFGEAISYLEDLFHIPLSTPFVIPAKAGTQSNKNSTQRVVHTKITKEDHFVESLVGLGPGLRRDDGMEGGEDDVWQNEKRLARYIRNEILKLGQYKILGNDDESSIISVFHEKAHHSDIGDVLNQCGVAIRTGHHCAQPLMKRLGITGTARISLGIYNDSDDADLLISGLKRVNQLFG